MRIRHLLSDSALRSSWVWPPFWNISYAHYSGLSQTGTEHLRESQAKHVSLYDELFSKGNEQTPTTPIETSNQEIEIPRLPLPSLGQFDTFSHRSDTSQQPVTKAAEASTQGSVRQWEPAVLTLSHASKSLVDSDFRRIMPKGRHIQELAGGGEIMRGVNDYIAPAKH